MKRCTISKPAAASTGLDATSVQHGHEARGASAGVPLFMRPLAIGLLGTAQQPAAPPAPVGPPVQMKCACGGSGSPCAACAEKDEQRPLQRKADGGASPDGGSADSWHDTAGRGVEGAHEPLPHLARIQASFGRRDVRGIKAQVGGAATGANEHMGSLGYTVADRVAFRSDPDIRLAAHEATHVVQQRAGVQLADGIGHPGDAYEQQADAVGDAVARGESAEPLLDRAPAGADQTSGAPALSNAPVQHLLSVNATRLFESPTDRSDAAPGSGEGGRASPGAATGEQPADQASAGEPPEAETEAQGDAQTASPAGTAAAPRAADDSAGASSAPDHDAAAEGSDNAGSAGSSNAGGGGATAGGASSSSAPAGSAGGAAPNGPSSASSDGSASSQAAAGGPATAESAGPQCAGSTEAKCYDKPSDQPANEPEEQPPNPEATKTQEETSDEGEQDAPEPDDCPPPADVGAPAAGGPPAASGGSASSSSPATGAAPAAGGETPAAAGAGGPGATTGAGGGGASSSGGGAAGGGGNAAAKPAASPMEGAIAGAEGQRADAVASYATSSAALAVAAEGNTSLRNRVAFRAPADETALLLIQRDDASQRASRFLSGAADYIDQAITFVSTQVPEQLGAQADAGKAEIAASIDLQKSAISSRIDGARGQARANAGMARQEVRAQAAAFMADAESQALAAVDALTTAHGEATGQITELETTTLEQVNETYATGRTDLEGLGTTIGGEATTTGERYATAYQGFRHCTENGFWDGDLSERRSQAQESAARSTAKGYHDRLVDAARKRAKEITKAGRKEDRCKVLGAASAARDNLDATRDGLISAIENARMQTMQQATGTRDRLIASINDSLATTLHQLDRQEQDQRQLADDTGYLQQVLQEQIAHAGAAALQQVVTSAASTLQSTLGQVQALFAENRPPDPDVLDEALSSIEQRITSAVDSLQGGAQGGLALASSQLSGAAGAGVSALDQVTQGNDAATSALSGGFTRSMSAIAGTDNFAPQRSAFSRLMQKTSSDGSAAMFKVVDAMAKGCSDTVASALDKLKKGHTDLENNLRQSKQGLECDITTKATDAASHEAPAWKMLVAILLIILVVIIIIAVIVVTAGGAAGPLAALIAAVGPVLTGAIVGAVVGAVTSALITMATDLWSNRALSLSRTLKAAAIGFVTGAIGGAAGAWIGGALQGFSLVVQYGAAMALAGGLDVVTQFVLGGFSFEHFSWANLGLTLLITALTLGLAHAVSARAPAPKTGGPPTNETTTTTSTTGEPTTTTAPGETATTSPPGETSTPPATQGETPTPTTAPAETSTPTATQGESPTPATAPAETNTPTATQGETPTPATAPPESGAPSAPESTPTATPEPEGRGPAAPPEEAPPSAAPPDQTPPATEEPPPLAPPDETPAVPPREEAPRVPATDEGPRAPAPEEGPRTPGAAEEPARAPASPEPTEPGAPPKNSEGRYDFEGRQGKQLSRDANSEPYPGESTADAQARAGQARQEIVNRLENLQPCFVAGTLVLSPDGPRPIESLEPGSLVMAMDPSDRGSARPHLVLERFTGESDSMCHITIVGERITSTQNHRFYVVDRGWIAARDLVVGDRLLTAAGGDTPIEELVKERGRPEATYNLHVADLSTYFVGDICSVLVHNANPNFNRELWWLFGNKASARPTDVDGVSLWRTTSEQDVIDMFKIRRGIEGRSSGDMHQAFTPEELAAKGVTVEVTEGNGVMAGRLDHGSARPAGRPPGDLTLPEIENTTKGINESQAAERITPKKMGCK